MMVRAIKEGVSRNGASFCGFMMVMSLCVPAFAETPSATSPTNGEGREGELSQVIVQIGGRYCEYHRKDVERALQRFPAVQSVEFLNDHGTVLVRYYSHAVTPTQLAASVEQALATGIGCKAWVDRGGPGQAQS